MTNIDFVIIGIFLVITLVIGLYYGRGISTFQDYAVGNRRLSTSVITVSLIATVYGAKALHIGFTQFYHKGFYALMYLSGPVSAYLVSKFLIVRMQEFVGHLSIAESMGSIYGPTVRIFTAVLGIILSIAMLVAQLKVGLNITTKLFTDGASLYVMMISLFVISYATFGGAKSVALTDLYQFLLFGLYIPLLIFILLYYNHNLLAGWKNLSTLPQFNLTRILTWDDTLKNTLTWLMGWSVFTGFNAVYIQRFYMTSSIPQAVKVFKSSSLMRMLFFTPLFLMVAVALHIGGHSIPPNQNILDYILHLDYFPGMQGILVTSIFALLMSTSDSALHTSSVLFTHDIWPVLIGVTKRINQHTLKVARMASVFIGLISLILAFHTIDLSKFLDKTGIYLFHNLIVSFPFTMTCLGFRPRAAAFLLSMGINTVIAGYVFCYMHQPDKHLSLIFSLSILALLVPHYLLPKRPGTGWVGIKDHSYWDLQNQRIKRWWLERFQQFVFSFTSKYRAAVFPKQARTFIRLGFYVIVSTTVALFCIKSCYLSFYVYGYMVAMAIGTILVLYPALHSYKPEGNPLLHWVWLGLLFMLLFIFSIQFVKLGHYRPMVCTLFICNLALAVLFLSLEASMIMLLIALLVHNHIPPHIPFFHLFWSGYTVFSLELVFAVAIGATTMVGLAIYKYLRNKAAATCKILERTRAYKDKIAVEAIYHKANWTRLDRSYGDQLFNETEQKLKIQGKQAIPLLMDNLRQYNQLLLNKAEAATGLDLDPKAIKTVTISLLITKIEKAIRRLGEPLQLLLRNQTKANQSYKHSPHTTIKADPTLLECLLLLNLGALHKCRQAEDHIITLTISDTILRYNNGIVGATGETVLTLPALALCFSTETHIQNILPIYDIKDALVSVYVPKTEKQFYQIESKQIVQAHGGYAEIIETQAVVTCLYVLPVDGQKVMHFKNYDPLDLAAVKVAETAESIAQEKELIALLTANTSLTQKKVVQTIAFIKNAHGLVVRKSGAPYYTHPMEVAKILLEITQDPVTILSGLLHDVVEDTSITLHQITMMYGKEVASIVGKLTEYHTNGYPWKLEDVEQKSVFNACSDIRVVQVKLADRLHNMRTLYARNPADQQRIAEETFTFYISWGRRNKGPQTWLKEMQEICRSVLDTP